MDSGEDRMKLDMDGFKFYPGQYVRIDSEIVGKVDRCTGVRGRRARRCIGYPAMGRG